MTVQRKQKNQKNGGAKLKLQKHNKNSKSHWKAFFLYHI